MAEIERKYTASEVLRIISGHVLNDMSVEDAEALKMIQFFPDFVSFIGGSLKKGVKLKYENKLYETRRGITNITGAIVPPDRPDWYRFIGSDDVDEDGESPVTSEGRTAE